ncbi:hypothetical protein SAMN05660748_3017 [Blastococcus aggregatus]|uniref:Uncharacterized protein n=1 Tax=Blastococcus aggregatus TaxID=38502 RepID=A0A285V824_9ACTN|nr:hypothetical protein [Blastococcus aggregatus]SOC50275.1 hypothetical protein SAMN05660748_3017 [Blastococcus aggregatus]
MGESVGVQAGRVCPRCGREDSVPLIYGMPNPDDFKEAERGTVVLGGCLMPEEPAAFACRTCELQWGSESDPTAGEAELAALLDVGHSEVVRALGAGWRRESGTVTHDGVAWFVSGEPAQVAIGVQGPWFVLARPISSWGEQRPGPLMSDGPRFTRDDVLHLPGVVADASERIASSRRRSFRWCRTCRRVSAPESFIGSAGACRQCAEFASSREG